MSSNDIMFLKDVTTKSSIDNVASNKRLYLLVTFEYQKHIWIIFTLILDIKW